MYAFQKEDVQNRKLLNFRSKPKKKKCSSQIHEMERWTAETAKQRKRSANRLDRFSLVKHQHYLFLLHFYSMTRENKSATEQDVNVNKLCVNSVVIKHNRKLRFDSPGSF